MSAISDFLNSAFSELFYDREPALGQVQKPPEEIREPVKKEREPFRRKGYEGIQEPISASGSLAEFDRVLGMLESADARTKNRAITAIEGISDENRLACISIFSKNPEARMAALKLVSKKAPVLAVIFSESVFRDTRLSAMSALSGMIESVEDQKALAVLACCHRDKRVRMRALGAVKEIKWLLEIAYSSKYEDARWEAIEMLKDQRVDIDKEDLRHDDTLSGLADKLVKSSAPEEEVIEDMEIMLDNVRYLQAASRNRKNDEFEDVIKDNLSAYESMLMSIATSSRHAQARELAVKGMEDDPAMLAEVAQHAEYEDTASMAVDKIAGSMGGRPEAQCLALVASMSEGADKRARAVSRLDNAQMLKHIVKYSQYDDSRIAAAHKLASMINDLDDAESLRLVIAYAKESKNRELAERRIAELERPQAAPAAKVPEKAREERKPQAEPAKDEKAPARESVQAPQPRLEPQSFGNQPSGGLWATIKELIGI